MTDLISGGINPISPEIKAISGGIALISGEIALISGGIDLISDNNFEIFSVKVLFLLRFYEKKRLNSPQIRVIIFGFTKTQYNLGEKTMADLSTDAGLLSHLLKQNDSIDEFQPEAGASAADVASIKEDYANAAALINLAPLAEEYKTTVTAIKRITLRGEIGAVVGKFKTAPDTTMPFDLVAGIEKRTRDRDARFKLSPTMTEAALFALDLKDGDPQPPAVVPPTIETFPAKTGYTFAVVIHDRGASDMAEVQVQRTGSQKWSTVKSGTGKSINVTIEPTTLGQPEQLLVRVQLLKKNENYAQPSEPAYVTVSP